MVVVYPCHAAVVAMQTSNGQQRFFTGHTDKVCLLLLLLLVFKIKSKTFLFVFENINMEPDKIVAVPKQRCIIDSTNCAIHSVIKAVLAQMFCYALSLALIILEFSYRPSDH